MVNLSAKFLLAAVLLPMALSTSTTSAQNLPSDSLQTLRKPILILATLTGGYSQSLTIAPPDVGDYSNGGLQGTFRLTLTRSRTIAIGVETGILPISSKSVRGLGDVDIDASLKAIPILLAVGTSTTGFDISVGVGYYNYISKSTLFGTTVTSKEWDMGMSAGVNYAYPLDGGISIGGEVRYGIIFDRDKSFLSVSLCFRLPPIEL
jgi:hypothetical protein